MDSGNTGDLKPRERNSRKSNGSSIISGHDFLL